MSEDEEHRMRSGLLVSEVDGVWMQYWPKLEVCWMRPYVEGEPMTHIAVSGVDKLAGHPRIGDMVARETRDGERQWLVTKDYLDQHYEVI
jgi:hypothetical protein